MDRKIQPKRILLLYSTTAYQIQAYLRAARLQNCEAVLGTDRCHVLEDPWQDQSIPIRFENPQESCETILRLIGRQPIHAVIPIGDRPSLTAAFVSRALGLRWNSPESVEIARNKYRMRECLQALGFHTPPFGRCSILNDPVKVLPNLQFPCILKPLDQTASFGVIRADDREEFVTAFQRIRGLLQSREVRVQGQESSQYLLVEGFIPGVEVSVEGILQGGTFKAMAIFDKPEMSDGPFFEETIYTTPSQLKSIDLTRTLDYAEKAVKAIGLTEGPVHVEIRVNEEGPCLLEVAPRSIGGYCSRALFFRSGQSLEEMIIRRALGDADETGEDQDPTPSGVMMIPIPRSGELQGVEGMERALKVPGITDIRISAKPNQYLKCLPEGSSYLGFIFARAGSHQGVLKALNIAHKHLHIRIRQPLVVS